MIKQWQKMVENEEPHELNSPWKSSFAYEDINRVYDIGRKLGSGFVGHVYKATLKSNPTQLYAVKSVEKKQLTKSSYDYFLTEVDILKATDCYYVIQFFEIYEDPKFFHIVMEMCEGGDLVSLVEKRNGLSESLCKKFFWQAAIAVNYLHYFGIAHRDIKLDNFLLTSKEPE